MFVRTNSHECMHHFAGALLPHLGTQAHGCLADAVEAFPNRPFVSPTHLHRFHQVLGRMCCTAQGVLSLLLPVLDTLAV